MTDLDKLIYKYQRLAISTSAPGPKSEYQELLSLLVELKNRRSLDEKTAEVTPIRATHLLDPSQVIASMGDENFLKNELAIKLGQLLVVNDLCLFSKKAYEPVAAIAYSAEVLVAKPVEPIVIKPVPPPRLFSGKGD